MSNRKKIILLLCSVLLFSLLTLSCSLRRLQKEKNKLQVEQVEDKQLWLQQTWQEVDSATIAAQVLIRPKGKVTLNEQGFEGEAEAILWTKKATQQKRKLHNQTLEMQRQASTRVNQHTQTKAKVPEPFYWTQLLLSATFLLALYLVWRRYQFR